MLYQKQIFATLDVTNYHFHFVSTIIGLGGDFDTLSFSSLIAVYKQMV